MTQLRPVTLSDAEFILKSRLDNSRSQYLSKIDNDLDAQRAWICSYLKRFAQELEYYFVIEDKSSHPWGLIRLYDIDRGQAQSFVIGSWLILPGAPLLTAQESMALGFEFAFHVLNLKISFFEVMAKNKKVIRFHQCYAEETARDSDFVHFKFTKENFEKSLFQSFLLR